VLVGVIVQRLGVEEPYVLVLVELAFSLPQITLHHRHFYFHHLFLNAKQYNIK